MAKQPIETEKRSRQWVVLGGLAIAIVVAGTLLTRGILETNKSGTPPGGASPSTAADTTAGRTSPAQEAAESTVGKSDPAGQSDNAGGRERAIKQSSRPLSLDEQQRRKVKDVIAGQQNPPKLDQAEFEMMIGTAVPKQVGLQDIPPEVTQIMNGYWGDQYVLVQDKLVIVDQHSRRIVAIVPSVA